MKVKIKKELEKDKTSDLIHKLNNILTNINLSADLLLQGLYGDLNNQQKKYIKTILSETKRIKELTKKINE